MLKIAFIFLLIAIISGYLGYKETYTAHVRNAKIAFYTSLILFLIFIIAYFLSPGPPPPAIPINPLSE